MGPLDIPIQYRHSFARSTGAAVSIHRHPCRQVVAWPSVQGFSRSASGRPAASGSIGEFAMRHDRRTFLKHVIGAASAVLAVPLFAACAPPTSSPAAPSEPQSAAPNTAPAAVTSVTKVSYAYASPNGFHFVATVGGEKPELAHKFGIEFDLLTTTNSPNAVNALMRDGGFPEIDNGNNYPVLKGVDSIILLSKTGWYQANPDLAANFLRSWDAITKWIYDPANKAELLAIVKKTMGGTDAGAEGVYSRHVTGKSIPQNLRINEKLIQQFVDNLKK